MNETKSNLLTVLDRALNPSKTLPTKADRRFPAGSLADRAQVEAERQELDTALLFPIAPHKQKLTPNEGLPHGPVTAKFLLKLARDEGIELVTKNELSELASIEERWKTAHDEIGKRVLSRENIDAWIAGRVRHVLEPDFVAPTVSDAKAAILFAQRHFRAQAKEIAAEGPPIFEVVANRLEKMLDQLIAKKLSEEISVAKEFELPYAPSAFLVTMEQARLDLPSQRDAFRAFEFRFALWGIVAEIRKAKAS